VLKLLAKNSFFDNVLAEYYLKKLMMWFNVCSRIYDAIIKTFAQFVRT